MKPRRRKCRAHSCRQWFMPWNSLQKACGPSCAIEVARADQAKEAAKEHQRQKAKVKPLTAVCADTQAVVNRYVRLRDQRKGCISCGSPFVTDAGHFVHAGSKYRTSRLRFDTRQIFGQCAQCNRFSGGGNKEGFIEGIRDRCGQAHLDMIYELQRQADRGELEPLTKDEAREIGREYRRKARELERERKAA